MKEPKSKPTPPIQMFNYENFKSKRINAQRVQNIKGKRGTYIHTKKKARAALEDQPGVIKLPKYKEKDTIFNIMNKVNPFPKNKIFPTSNDSKRFQCDIRKVLWSSNKQRLHTLTDLACALDYQNKSIPTPEEIGSDLAYSVNRVKGRGKIRIYSESAYREYIRIEEEIECIMNKVSISEEESRRLYIKYKGDKELIELEVGASKSKWTPMEDKALRYIFRKGRRIWDLEERAKGFNDLDSNLQFGDIDYISDEEYDRSIRERNKDNLHYIGTFLEEGTADKRNILQQEEEEFLIEENNNNNINSCCIGEEKSMSTITESMRIDYENHEKSLYIPPLNHEISPHIHISSNKSFTQNMKSKDYILIDSDSESDINPPHQIPKMVNAQNNAPQHTNQRQSLFLGGVSLGEQMLIDIIQPLPIENNLNHYYKHTANRTFYSIP